MRSAVGVGIAFSIFAGAAYAQTGPLTKAPPPPTPPIFENLFELDDGGWHLKPFFGAPRALDEERGKLIGTAGPPLPDQKSTGVQMNVTQRLIGKLQYQWTDGEKPSLGIDGVPAKFKLVRGGFLLGFSYRP